MATTSDIYIAWVDKSLVHAAPFTLGVPIGSVEREIIKASNYMRDEGMQGLPQIFEGGIPTARAVGLCRQSMTGRRRMKGEQER